MKKIKKLMFYATVVFIMTSLFSIPVMATEMSDFTRTYSATLDGDVLTVVLDVTAPAAVASKQSVLNNRFSIDGGESFLNKAAEEYSDAVGFGEFGKTYFDASYGNAMFVFVTKRGDTAAYAGGNQCFTIKFDVSDLDIESGTSLTVHPAYTYGVGGTSFGVWNGVNLTTDVENAQIGSCTISGNGGGENVSEEPSITIQPATATYTKDATATPLSVVASASDGGTLSYQWYSNTSASTEGATAIDGATVASYTPSTVEVGTTYYYCVVTNTKDALDPAPATSDIVAVTVNEAAAPTYTASLSDQSAEEVLAGNSFTADVYMTSSDALACGQLTFATTNCTITNIAMADGLSNGSNENNKLSFYGNTASAASGLKVATITAQVNADATGTASLSIQSATAGKSGEMGNLQVTLDQDAAVSVTVKEADKFTCTSYAAGKYLIEYKDTVAESNVVQYGSNTMLYSPLRESWVYLVDSDLSESLTNESFSVGAGEKITVGTLRGDVNGSNEVDIVDAQAAFDIASGVYTSLENPTMLQWLIADANGSGTVDASDARAIQVYAHTNSWS